VNSIGEARRLVQNGGLRVNDVVIADPNQQIGRVDLRDGVLKISLGKKKHVLVKPA
jgi:tyrosyl-tRNA synthetase